MDKSPSDSDYVTVKTTYVTEQFGFDPREVSRTWVTTREEHLQTQKKQQQQKIEQLDKKLLSNARGRKEEPKKPQAVEKRKEEDPLSLIDKEFLRLTDLLVPQIILPRIKTVSRHVEPDGKNVITTVEKFFTGEDTIDNPKTTYTRTTTETFYENEEEREDNEKNMTQIKEKEADKKKDQEKPPQQPQQTPQQEVQKDSGEKSGELTTTGDKAKTSVVTTTKDLPHGGKEKTVTNTTVEKLPDGMKKTTTKTTRHVTFPDGFEESETKIVITTSTDDQEPPKENPPEESKKAE